MKRLGVAGIIHHPDEPLFLLGRRGKDPNRGLLVLPGGGVQEGESLEDAFVREVLEETGLQIMPTVGYSRWERPDLIELHDRIVLVGMATAIVGTINPSKDSDLYDVSWYGYLELPDDISPVVEPVLQIHGYRKKKVT